MHVSIHLYVAVFYRVFCSRQSQSIQTITCYWCLCNNSDLSWPSIAICYSTTRSSSHTVMSCENTHTTCAHTSRSGPHTPEKSLAGKFKWTNMCVFVLQVLLALVFNVRSTVRQLYKVDYEKNSRNTSAQKWVDRYTNQIYHKMSSLWTYGCFYFRHYYVISTIPLLCPLWILFFTLSPVIHHKNITYIS